MKNNDNQNYTYVFLSVLIVLLLTGGLLLDVTSALINDKPIITSHLVKTDRKVQSRFRAVYTGKNMPTHSANATHELAVPSVSAVGTFTNSKPALTSLHNESTRSITPVPGNGISSLQSAHTTQSYGGGTSVGTTHNYHAYAANRNRTQHQAFATAIPAIARNIPPRVQEPSYASGIRTIHREPGYDGSSNGQGVVDGGQGWIWIDGEWAEAAIGDRATIDGIIKEWNGSGWITSSIDDIADPSAEPIGDIPALLLALFATAYIVAKRQNVLSI